MSTKWDSKSTVKVQVVIDKQYYDLLLENQKTPQESREWIRDIVRILRSFKNTKLWTHSEMADFLEKHMDSALSQYRHD